MSETLPLKLKEQHGVNVRGTELLTGDTHDQYRQKLARITLDSMVQFVGLLDAKGTVLEINQVALDGGGLRLSDVEGKPFWTTFWWQVSPEINKVLKESILRAAKGEFVRWDTEIYGRAGGKETIVIDASLCPVKDERGRVVFITAEGRDITEKKAHEREIARQREALAKLDELKTQFFANVSHEFRTPLTLMLGPLEESIADTKNPLTPPQLERQELIYRNSVRLLKLVNTLLDFSRIEAGRAKAAYRPTDLSRVTADLTSVFRAAIEKAGLTLTVNTPPLSDPVYVDPEMWEKIVLNLLSNAFKFTFTGGITVSLIQKENHIELSVHDTGTGIPASEVAHVFERFHRVEGAKGRTLEGSGIGLALIQELVKLHGGTISLTSELQRGSTFTVHIPLGKAHLPQECIQENPVHEVSAKNSQGFEQQALCWVTQPAAGSSPKAIGGKRILVADDNADLRLYLKNILSETWEVDVVENGENALASALENPPDLILSDVMMPGLDGFGLIKELKKRSKTRFIPVVLLSARAGEEAKIEGLKSGADDYLIKPFSATELTARVRSQLTLRESHQKLVELNKTLEQEAVVNTDALRKKEAELQQAMKLEAIGRLTGGVAHDFNNLLTGILGVAEDLKSRFANDSQTQEEVEQIINAAQRAFAVTKQLLAFGRRQLVEPKVLDLNAAVVDINKLLQRLLGEDITIHLNLGEVSHIRMDHGHLEQVLLNLSVNARDAMPNGGQLTLQTSNVRLRSEDLSKQFADFAPGAYVVLDVIDTGTGIARDALPHIFEPFFTTKERDKGTGLGLSMVHDIVKQCGGGIQVESERGRGTTFKILFPAVSERLDNEEKKETLTHGPSGQETIIVIEDEDIVRRLVLKRLRRGGYTVLEASNGKEAMNVLAQHAGPVDMVITDVVMPGMNGREIVDRIRQAYPEIAVLFMSGYPEDVIAHRGILEPGINFIEKPQISGAGLLTKVREVLESRKS